MSDDDRVFAKCAWRLIPFITLLYVVNYIDRVNVGFAALTMNEDVGLSPSQFGFGAGIFFFSYALSQIPASVMLERIGPRRAMFGILLTWGAISAANAFVFDPLSFYVLRFSLGIAEAGFFPGMIFYLSLWFPKAYLGRCIGIFMASNPLAVFMSAPLSGLILGLNGYLSLSGWQWLFLLEGLPACLLALAVFRLLPDGPMHAPWLKDEEKAAILARLESESAGSKRDFAAVFFDPRVYALGVAGAGLISCQIGIQLWLPQIVQAMGFSNIAVGYIVGLQSVMAAAVMVLWSYSSDVKGERVWHYVLAAMFTVTGLVAASTSDWYGIVMLGLTMAVVGQFAALPIGNTLAPAFLRGPALAAGVALYNTMSQLGGFAGSLLMGALKQQTGSYAEGLLVLALGMLMAAAAVFAVGRMMQLRKMQLA